MGGLGPQSPGVGRPVAVHVPGGPHLHRPAHRVRLVRLAQPAGGQVAQQQGGGQEAPLAALRGPRLRLAVFFNSFKSFTCAESGNLLFFY